MTSNLDHVLVQQIMDRTGRNVAKNQRKCSALKLIVHEKREPLIWAKRVITLKL